MADQENTIAKMRALLQPMETTKLDDVINIVFSTAQDVVEEPDAEPEPDTEKLDPASPHSVVRTPVKQLDLKREQAVSAFGRQFGHQFVRQRKTLYKNDADNLRLCAVVSKNISQTGSNKAQLYWYNYHPHWDAFLKPAKDRYVIFACMDRNSAFAVPYEKFVPLLPHLAQTKEAQRMYWHIPLIRQADGELALRSDSGKANLLLKPFEFHWK